MLPLQKLASQYQKEADKCNSGMETCEEVREKAEEALLAQMKLTAMWEIRARQKGWREKVAKSNAQTQGKTNYTRLQSKNNLQKAHNDWLLPLQMHMGGIAAANKNDIDQHTVDTVCALNPNSGKDSSVDSSSINTSVGCSAPSSSMEFNSLTLHWWPGRNLSPHLKHRLSVFLYSMILCLLGTIGGGVMLGLGVVEFVVG
ncbi:uncharacterized protein [Gossypium hirsutum]|uniref:Uncharacterized protein isoform X4 n=1 Tax=Gossypium hirsutum TaxID=3635 RepID=A0ABM2Z715_GOSHI|nr:uncharacterized protein LOC107891771 isoform X4 [Gossypium hirsutum]